MEEKRVNTWEECQEFLFKLQGDIKSRSDVADFLYASDLLYRGHADANWKLETTLERYVNDSVSLVDYHQMICRIKPMAETFIKQRWDIPSPSNFREWVNKAPKANKIFFSFERPLYEYMAFLRHNGFPSPLLDWSQSFYVATFFAFSDVGNEAKDVAIFIYCEDVGKGKTYVGGTPFITEMGAYIKTHPRHFLQQSQYTISTQEKDQRMIYFPHEKTFACTSEEQDLLIKVIVPASEREKVMKQLDSMNINAFSLFGTDESLMQTLAMREIYFERSEESNILI